MSDAPYRHFISGSETKAEGFGISTDGKIDSAIGNNNPKSETLSFVVNRFN
jgi:hypothetical protein